MRLEQRIELYAPRVGSATLDVVEPVETQTEGIVAELGIPVSILELAISPELILVSPPEVAELARQLLPDPEPLDEWVARMRREELEREWRAFLADVRTRPVSELVREKAPATAFVAAAVVFSVLPFLAVLVLGV
jgi:hypothetical protein